MNRKPRKTDLCFLLGLLPFAVACTDGSHSAGDVQPVRQEQFEVTLVFEPGQLGDRSTNDRLLADLCTFGTAHADSVTTSFISYPTYAETRQALQLWAATPDADDTAQQQRRLLVVAAPSVAPLLTDIEWAANDRLLLLRTPLTDAKAVGPEGRTHVMNVSLKNILNAHIDRELARYDAICDELAPDDVIDGPFRIIRTQAHVAWADSIVETFRERFPDQQLSDDPDEGIWQSGITDGTDDNPGYAQELAYSLAILFDESESDDDDDELHRRISVVDLGMGNTGFEYYYFTHAGSETRTLVVGDVLSVDSRLDYAVMTIPLNDWLETWLTNSDELPEEEWHGAWDGCAQYSPASERTK